MEHFRRSAVRIVGINAILICTGLLVIELCFGNWFGSRIHQLNLVVDRVIRYNLNSLYPWPDAIITYSRDRYGLRGPFTTPAEIDILTIGGSTTDQRFIADGSTWQDVLAKHLINPRTGRPVQIANAGVDGQSSYGHLKNFDWWFPYIPGLRPKYVLVYLGVNDLLRPPGSDWDVITDRSLHKKQIPSEEVQTFTDEELGVAYRNRLIGVLEERSAIYRSLIVWSGIRKAKVAQLSTGRKRIWYPKNAIREGLIPRPEMYVETVAAPYRERLAALDAKIRQLGAVPIFVAQPAFYGFNDGGHLVGSDAHWGFVGQTLNGVDMFRAERELDRSTLASCPPPCIGIDLAGMPIWTQDDFYDFVHNTPQGAVKIGEKLAESLQPYIDSDLR